MKNIVISGGIGKDAVTRTTQQGDKVTGFSVGGTEGYGDSKRTIWFDVAIWGKRGDSLSRYLTKGSRVAVAGDISTREHEGRTYLTVRADQITLMGGGEKREHVEMPPKYAGTEPADYDQRRRDMDDEIPF